MTKDIVGRLRDEIVLMVKAARGQMPNLVTTCGENALRLIETLSPPDGVGLTRYRMWAKIDWTVDPDVDPEGKWVRHEDAAAALADAKVTIADLEKRLRAVYEREERVVVIHGGSVEEDGTSTAHITWPADWPPLVVNGKIIVRPATIGEEA